MADIVREWSPCAHLRSTIRPLAPVKNRAPRCHSSGLALTELMSQIASMNFTTQAATVADHKFVRPEFIRLPKPGTSDPWTGLSRSTLNILVLPCHENRFKPPVRSCTLRRAGSTRGVRLIDFQSLLSHINSLAEPSCATNKQSSSDGGTEHERERTDHPKGYSFRANETLRIILSIRVEHQE